MASALTPRALPAPGLYRGQPVASARLHVTALGLYEARLNGHRVGDAFLTPGWTDYAQRVLYQTYDVTGLLARARTCSGAILADGWYSGFVGFDAKRAGRPLRRRPGTAGPAGDHAGRRQRAAGRHRRAVASSAGAIRHADLLMGERHDLRLEPAGWDAPGFDAGTARRPVRRRLPRAATRDAAGRRPRAAGPGHRGDRAAQHRHRRPRAAHRRLRAEPDRLAADQGRRAARARRPGPARRGARGRRQPVHRQPAHRPADRRVHHGRRPRRCSSRGSPCTGSGTPRSPATPATSARPTSPPGSCTPTSPAAGSFESSQPWLDQLFRNIDWGQRGNFISVPTDCPQRDERLGWLGDAQVFARTACYNRDVAAFFAKWLDDVADAQLPSGAFTDIAPRLNLPGAGAPAWGDAGVIVPWTVWKMYGDTGRPGPALRRHDRVDGLPRAGQPRLPADPGARATATTTGSPRAATTPRTNCSPPPTGPTTRR